VVTAVHAERDARTKREPVNALSRSSWVQQRCSCGGIVGPDGECAACRARRLARQSTLTAVGRTPARAPRIVHEVLRASGKPLDRATRAFFEPRFGHDFSRVRVHTDGQAAASARAVHALAYTVGRHIVFGSGQFTAATSTGRALLAHELAHTIHQERADHSASNPLEVGESGSSSERSAEQAERSVGNRTVRAPLPLESLPIVRPQLQRQPSTPPTGDPASPTRTGRCYTCDIPGGLGICCYAEHTPVIPKCLEIGEKIIDQCRGNPTSCLREAQCAQCQCMGPPHCQCTGMV
jgi:hypothetical protein